MSLNLHIAVKVPVGNYPLPPIPKRTRRAPQPKSVDMRVIWLAMPEKARSVLRSVSEERGITVVDILSSSKRRPIYLARQEAMKRLRSMSWCGTVPSFPLIGRWLNRDHTTVMEACGARQHHRRRA